MWSGAVAGLSLLYVVLIYRGIRRAESRFLAFAIFALGLRYLLAAFPDITQRTLAAGVSPIALSSFAICALGLLVIDRRSFQLRFLLSLYGFLCFMVIAALANGELRGLITSMSRFIYLLVLMLAIMRAMDRLGPQRVFRALLPVFFLPVALQLLSALLGLDSNALRSGSELSSAEVRNIAINYIGPYGHESGFSMILLSLLLCIAFWKPRSGSLYWCLFLLALICLVLANYRTAVLAVLPIMCAVLATRYAGAIVARHRPFAVTVAVAIALPAMLVAIASSDFAERFADIAKIQLDTLALRPNFVTDAERDLLSARLYIWSQYLTAFRDANLAQQLVGFGPESWRGAFPLYAHNTFVSYLYEFGYLGLGAFLFFWVSNIVVGLRIREAEPRLLVFAAYAGFTILNLATMPVWQIEGLIFFAILNGTAMHYALRGANATGPATHEDKASQNRGPYAGAI